ncbi:MAG: HTH domain-containing protein [Candidatus Bathyarchaeia archaeon]
MNSIEAAVKVLADAGEPLHYKNICRRILEQGLWKTQGKTPESTVNANLAKEIQKNGEKSRFQRTDPGTFALRKWGLPEYYSEIKGKRPEIEDDQRPATTLSFNDAAEVVLDKHSNRQPMHYQDITAKMLELDLIHTEGQTPEATLYAQIITEIKRHTKRGETPRFVMHGKGYVGLRKWMGYGLTFQVQRHNADVRKKLLSQLKSKTLPAAEFEALIAKLLVVIGFDDVVVTKITNDGGIDVRGTLVVGEVIKIRMAVQAKKWKNNVQSPTVQQVRGSLGSHEQGLIITTSDFSKGAKVEADRPDATPVALMNGKQLVDLLIEHDIGIRRTALDLLEMEEITLEEISSDGKE